MAYHPDYCDCKDCVNTYWGISRKNMLLQQQAVERRIPQELLQNVADIQNMTRQAINQLTTEEPEPLYTEFEKTINRLSRSWEKLSLTEQEKVKPRAAEKAVARKVFEKFMEWSATIIIWVGIASILSFLVDTVLN
jgi:hypothetical protein